MRVSTPAMVILVCSFLGAGGFGSVLPNGDFETGDFTNWSAAGYAEVVSHDTDWRLDTVDGSTYAARLGNEAQAVRILGDPDESETSLKRMLDAMPYGGILTFAYDLQAWSAVLEGESYDGYKALSVTLDGTEILSVDAPAEYDRGSIYDVYSSGWQELTYVLPSTSDPIELAFFNTESGTDVPYSHGAWFYVDNVDFVAAPECPPALLISAAGAFGWVLRCRRRRPGA